MRLILFDVDGTLLTAGKQVRRIFGGALTEVFGAAGDLDGYDFRGKTDPRIVVELLAASGLSAEQVRHRMTRVRDLYLKRLEAELDGTIIQVFGGVREALDDLSRRPDVVLGLLTGNWQRGARIKLGRVGLDHYFPFGAFGCDGEDRADLPPRAWARARDHLGISFGPDSTWIVGDSTEDVRCGMAHGIPVLGVTTGWTSREELLVDGAEQVMESLAELTANLEL